MPDDQDLMLSIRSYQRAAFMPTTAPERTAGMRRPKIIHPPNIGCTGIGANGRRERGGLQVQNVAPKLGAI